MFIVTSRENGQVVTHETFETEKRARNHAFAILKSCDIMGVNKDKFIFELCNMEDEITI